QAISVICAMEIEQNGDRFKNNVSMRNYFRKIMGKSALLFSLACFTGAYEANLSLPLCNRFRRLGHNIGIAFQIIDDILDYSGDQMLVGKPLGNDISAGLITLPAICALRLDNTGLLRDIFSRDSFTPEEAKIIFTHARERGGVEAAGKYAMTYTCRALRDIAALPPGENRDVLETLTKRLLLRQQ
ncbi:MAG: polyprenyl synthetase family protein, partial [Treponema sp.]|nr:polyprenyl synthetase family protein [Treponema sp.]